MKHLAIFTANGSTEAFDPLKSAVSGPGLKALEDGGFALLLAKGLPASGKTGKPMPETGKFLPDMLTPVGMAEDALPDTAVLPDGEQPSPETAASPATDLASLVIMSQAAAQGLPSAERNLAPEQARPPMPHAQPSDAPQLPEHARRELATSAPGAVAAEIRALNPVASEGERKPGAGPAPVAPANPAAPAPVAQPQDGFSLEVSRIAGDPVPAQPALPSTAPARDVPSAVRPHDFAALVDRLVEARDVTGHRTANLTVNHADFGAVTMRFEQGERGLSVALSSPDPDFTRAVSAAAAALPAQSERDSNQQGSNANPGTSARQDAAASTGQGQTGPRGQDRGQAGRDDRVDPNAPPSDNAKPQGRSRKGIFA